MLTVLLFHQIARAEPMRYLRFEKDKTVAYGILEGDRVRQLDGDLFGKWNKTDVTPALLRMACSSPPATHV